jgi:alpha-ketoglutarate-dependent taurine dioxygenase
MLLHPHEGFDNAAAPYRHIEAVPLAAAMGAEIRGVDVADVGDAAFAEIEHALFRHKMIFFRAQRIGDAEHKHFSRRFGPFAEDAYTVGVRGHPEVQPVIKEADDNSAMVFGSGWHTDSPFLAEPPSISTLRAVEVPPFGGDTLWANSALAYRMLSETMRHMIAGLRVRFSMRDVLASAQRNVERRDTPIGRLAATRDLGELPESLAVKVRGHSHPLIRTHPVSGEKSLYVDGSYAIGIEGLEEAEGAALLRFLVEHITQPVFTCRLRWEPGTLTLWDNRLCVHQAFNDYTGHRREMYRTTIAGERPA